MSTKEKILDAARISLLFAISAISGYFFAPVVGRIIDRFGYKTVMITIFIALFGGLIWQKLGIETLFVLSAVLGLCNSAYAATIKTKRGE